MPARASLPLRGYKNGDLRAALSATAVFDSARATGDTAKALLNGDAIALAKDVAGRFHLTPDTPPVDLIVQGTTGPIEHSVIVDADDGKLCDSTITMAAMFKQVAEAQPKQVAPGVVERKQIWIGAMRPGDDTKTACYEVGPILPDKPTRVAVTFDLSGVEVLWVPVTPAGDVDPGREGLAVWTYFDLYNPNGAGHAARMAVAP